MTDGKKYRELIQNLRGEAACYPDDCDYCSAEGKCRCQRIGQACDAAEELLTGLEAAEKELKLCRNELCLRCGDYIHAHEGWCNGCRWQKAAE